MDFLMAEYSYDPKKPIFADRKIRVYGTRDQGKILQINKAIGAYAEKTGYDMLLASGYPERVKDCIGGCDFLVKDKNGKILFAAEVKANDADLTDKQKKFKAWCDKQKPKIPYKEIHFNVPQNIVNMIDHFRKEEYYKK